jgi:hypothetical protein
LKDFNQPEHPLYNPSNRSLLPSTSTNTYDLTKILNKKKSKTTVTIPELHSENSKSNGGIPLQLSPKVPN